MKKEIVKTPNNIVKGKIEIDAQINKLYYRILFNIQRQNRDLIIDAKKGDELTEEQKSKLEKLNATPYLSCRLYKTDIYAIVKRRNEQTADEIEKKFNALQTAVFKFSTGESNVMTQLIGAVTDIGEYYTIDVNTALYKHLLYYVEVGYTPINLAVLFSLRSPHAQSLYIALRKWSGTKREIYFTVDEIRSFMNCENKYKAFKTFKQNAILPAIEGINKTGSMEILDIKEKKEGRSIIGLTFVIKDNEPRLIEQKAKDPKPLEEYLWLDRYKVADKKIAIAIETMLGEMNYESPIVLGILDRAYATTIAKDKNGEILLTALNMGLFITIANGEFETNALGALSSIQ